MSLGAAETTAYADDAARRASTASSTSPPSVVDLIHPWSPPSRAPPARYATTHATLGSARIARMNARVLSAPLWATSSATQSMATHVLARRLGARPCSADRLPRDDVDDGCFVVALVDASPSAAPPSASVARSSSSSLASPSVPFVGIGPSAPATVAASAPTSARSWLWILHDASARSPPPRASFTHPCGSERRSTTVAFGTSARYRVGWKNPARTSVRCACALPADAAAPCSATSRANDSTPSGPKRDAGSSTTETSGADVSSGLTAALRHRTRPSMPRRMRPPAPFRSGAR